MMLDAFFRFSSITLLLLIVIMLLRDLRHSKTALYLWLACISLIALFLGFTPKSMQLPEPLKMIVRFLDTPHLIFIWLFALSLFQKAFTLTMFHWLTAFVYSGSIIYVRLFQYKLIEYLPTWWIPMVEVFSIALMIHMIFVTLNGRSDDLIEKRRKSRLYFIFIIATIAISTALIEFIGTMNNWTTSLPTVKVLTIWPAIIWLSFWLLSIKPHQLTFDEVKQSKDKNLSTKDQMLLDKLEKEIIENQAYLENGLTITTLAKKLGVIPHRLRDFINQTLDHDNFSSYINSYRIQAIKKTLMDKQNDHIPILTLAMQHGFNSISPFNRAFKAIQGITPSEFRKNNTSVHNL